MSLTGLEWENATHIVFFTGAGMSAESGVPTYRGKGGIWGKYNWEEYACQDAFVRSPDKVLDFHERRREAVLRCEPHEGHRVISQIETLHPDVTVITQNIDGMHQRAGSRNVIELHGSLWRLRCRRHGIREDHSVPFTHRRCPDCGEWLRPDITWFGDSLDSEIVTLAMSSINHCDLFVSIGTSGIVWPAAGFPRLARERGARLVEINPEATVVSPLYDMHLRDSASRALPELFPVVASAKDNP